MCGRWSIPSSPCPLPVVNFGTAPPQALPLLQKEFPIERARMRLRLTVPVEAQQELEQLLQREAADVAGLDVAAGGMCVVVAQVEPGVFRDLNNFMQVGARAGALVEAGNTPKPRHHLFEEGDVETGCGGLAVAGGRRRWWASAQMLALSLIMHLGLVGELVGRQRQLRPVAASAVMRCEGV